MEFVIVQSPSHLLDKFLQIIYTVSCFGNDVIVSESNNQPETVRSLAHLSDARILTFTDFGSVHQDRTSCRCLVRRSVIALVSK